MVGRGAFDAMRAYHQSEISHKQDAIGMLTTLLTAVGAIFGAIVIPEGSIKYPVVLACATAAVTVALAAVIVLTTNKKIQADHDVYASFGAEYMRACEVLDLYESVPGIDPPLSVKVKVPIGQGAGYRKTQHIVTSVGASISALATLAAVYVWLMQP